MSQSHTSKDSQALLQSMLQRLKLKPEAERQAGLHTDEAPTCGKDGARGDTDLQKHNNSPTNGYESGISTKSFEISPVDSISGLKDSARLQPIHGFELHSSPISFPPKKDNSNSYRGENKVTFPVMALTGTGQPLPVRSRQNVEITSFKRTNGEIQVGTENFDYIAGNKNPDTSMGQNQVLKFRPKAYEYSLKTTDCDKESQHNKVLYVGNGGTGALYEDIHAVPSSQTTANTSTSTARRRQRSPENKTRRWTQKIKERWMESPGSLVKKLKKEKGRQEDRNEQGNESSPQNQLLTSENLIDKSDEEGERTFPLLNTSGASVMPSKHSEDGTSNEPTRLSDDVAFGLGSFSLLEEIITGQEWAKFLSPTQSAPSANQRSSEETVSRLKITPNPYDGGESSLILKRTGNANNQWRLKCSRPSPASSFRRPQISAEAFLPVSTDVAEGKQGAVQDADSRADQSEPMKHCYDQSNMQPEETAPGQQSGTPSIIESADILDDSSLKSKVYSNRKRQHQSAQGRDERLQAEWTSAGTVEEREGSISSPSSHVMDDTGESKLAEVMPLFNSPPPTLFPTSSSTSAPAPRGVLKHTISQVSDSSLETVLKKRRVETNRRVHFSDEVMTIAPVELDLDSSDSEEDSEAEDECEVDGAATEELASARRPALPAWIRALKRRSTGRKHR